MIDDTGLRKKKYTVYVLVLCLFFLSPQLNNLSSSFNQPRDKHRYYSDSISALDNRFFASYETTRKEAIIDYIEALQSPEGYFHAYLQAPPPFDLDGTPPSYVYVQEAYETLRNIDSFSSINWTVPIQFLTTLIDNETGLLNMTKFTGPNVYSCRAALIFYYEIGADEEIILDEVIDFLAALQQSDGGFIFDYGDARTSIIETYFALEGLASRGYLDHIDVLSASDFVLSCYNEDGGFGNMEFSESDLTRLPAALNLVEILDLWDGINQNETLNYILQFWDNEKGCDTSEDLLYTYYLAWSLWIMDMTDAINSERLVQWLLSLQHSQHGGFVGYPEAESTNERLVSARYVTHLLNLYDGLDELDGEITILETPEWEIPQWWIDYINEEWGTTTTHDSPNNFALPDLRFLVGALPYIAIVMVIMLPAIAISYQARMRRVERRELKKQRKKRKR